MKRKGEWRKVNVDRGRLEQMKIGRHEEYRIVVDGRNDRKTAVRDPHTDSVWGKPAHKRVV